MIISERIKEIDTIDGLTLREFNDYINDLLVSHPQYTNIRFDIQYDHDYQTIYLKGDREETLKEREKREGKEAVTLSLKEAAKQRKLERDRKLYDKLKTQFNDIS